MWSIWKVLPPILCNHEWSPWYVARERLVGPYGTTESDVNERKCAKCEFRQRKRLLADDK